MTTTKEEQTAEKEGTVLDEFSEQPAVFSIRRESTDDGKISDCKDEQVILGILCLIPTNKLY
ncbi:hypothetical protein GCK32_022577 [Trichostrongylus colubriformis]|uniref:Uncharacterized protein n=1 Tax=Trichostrongylus colubriformis TaxID=6319 RepID=A0AAN8F7A3_TRICO